jgi:hypothetical protein
MKNKKEKQPALTDAQLAAKYDTGKQVNLEEAVKKMAKGSSNTAKNKGR